LDFQDAEVANVMRLIADVSDLNLVVGEEVKGKITLKLFNVPWDQALDIILKAKGLGQVREGNIIRIDTNGNIAKQQDEAAKAKEAQVKAEDLKTLIIPINYAEATALSTTLKKNLSSRGELTVNESTNSLIAKDIQQNIVEIQQLIKLLDLPKPQVLIETRIVQANTNFARDLGVQWGVSTRETSGSNQIALNAGATGAFNSQAPTFAVNLPASGGAGPIGNVGVQFGRLTGVNPFNLDLRLSAGEVLGDTKIISSPRVVTIDNKEAVIQQGDSIPYETTSNNGTQTQFVDATLNLTVTPHITPNGSVIMKIKATKNAIGSFTSARTGAPSISKREASTEVMVQDGETTVIGGIFETSRSESVTGVPWFYQIPVVGWLFKRESTSTTNQELLIFITPTIVKRV
jgi:type IV pilus assembly protein PilQ